MIIVYATILNQVWWSIPKGIGQPLFIASKNKVIRVTFTNHNTTNPPNTQRIFFQDFPVLATTKATQKL